MVEVPDEEDDTSFLLANLRAAAADADACGPFLKRKSPLLEREAECPTGNDTSVSKGREAAKHVPLMVAPHEWLKPFETEWTWRAIKDAKSETAGRAVLLNWIHKTRAEEVVDNLLEGLCSIEQVCTLDWLDELHKSKRYFIRSQNSSSRDLLIPVQLETLEGRIIVSAKALIDSGCTGSSIHCDFVEKNGNPAGEITTYAELRIKIGNHSERIDLTITDLSSKEIFLGHDWLIHHNPIINWATGKITFARCPCAKNKFVLPDADPDNEWELQEGEMILTVDFKEAIKICTVHHANELATVMPAACLSM
ncbi:uncharacterized protein ARMOST_22595 [Armillaria ostoyae]|uniref:Peptidase A2 domain-containing protein n=1 Tax=Armillaria ostoyae TaxID=47428 RepID=A0A284SDC4_ARMOS|nr:uncharacterized protein ARMOST_22595 [Armillaria ostoyae]